MQNYRATAEGVVLQAFLNLDKETQNALLAEKKSTQQYFEKNTTELKQTPKKVPKQHLKILLEVIGGSLPAETQSELFRLELYDLLEIYRQKLTQKGSFTIDEAFDLYSNYLRFLYGLQKFDSTWFSPLTFQSADWTEVVEAVKFVVVTRLRASALHFRKDLHIIAQNSERIAAKIMYAVDFLGIKVLITKTNYSLDRLYTFDEFPIPVFVGKLAETLKAYVFEALNDTQYQLAIQEMQEGLLAHDFKVVLEHYKQSKPLFNKVDFSFSLKGGAGSVSMHIKTWASLGKRIAAFFATPQVVSISVVTFFVSLAGLVVWGIPHIDWRWLEFDSGNLMAFIFLGAFVSFILYMLVRTLVEFKIEIVDEQEYGQEVFFTKRSEKTYTKKIIHIMRPSAYAYILAEKRQYTEAQAESENPFERIYGTLWIQLSKQMEKGRYHQLTTLSVSDEFLGLCREAYACIAELKSEEVSLPVMRYLFFKRLHNVMQMFFALCNFAKKYNLRNLTYYMPFFDMEKTILFSLGHVDSLKERQIYTQITEKMIYPILDEEDEELRLFLVGKLQEMQADTFSAELAELTEAYQNAKSNFPFLLEGNEMVATFGEI